MKCPVPDFTVSVQMLNHACRIANLQYLLWKYSVMFVKALGVILLLLCLDSVHSQIVISDSTFHPDDWGVMVVSELGGEQYNEQRTTGGNPDTFRFMRHTLPAPPHPDSLTRIEVVHVLWNKPFNAGNFEVINSLDFTEDIRLMNLQWQDAFVTSSPIVVVGGRTYRSTQFHRIIGDTTSWSTHTLTGLTEQDFVAMDGSGDHPDFYDFGPWYFGYWRVHTRSFTLPPIPAAVDLVYEHGCDNFTVTVHLEPPDNNRPTASEDHVIYLGYLNFPREYVYDVLANDSDPDGDSIWIWQTSGFSDEAIVNHSSSTISYEWDSPEMPFQSEDIVFYDITDGVDSAGTLMWVHFCVCPIDCISYFATDSEENVGGASDDRNPVDSLDVQLFRRLRDEHLADSVGGAMIDFYYSTASELIPLLLIEKPQLGAQALRALGLLQLPVSNLLDGDGKMTITQALVDSVSIFLDSLLVSVSDTTREDLLSALQALCPLQSFVDMPVSVAASGIFCDSTTAVRDVTTDTDFRIAPNPFRDRTSIEVHSNNQHQVIVNVFDLNGKAIKSIRGTLMPDDHLTVEWDGKDYNGNFVAPGIYIVQMIANGRTRTARVVLSGRY